MTRSREGGGSGLSAAGAGDAGGRPRQGLCQIELEGPDPTAIAAASLEEWQRAHDAGRLDEYDSRFGITAGLPVSEWEGHDPLPLTSEEFEEVWRTARRHIAARPS
ncbi:hypothetical protein ACFV6Z_32130 [Streptomyces sp. NPDC059818]|uniref:hypothetical protein n=1 Tax=Streptomyces sp. NPDC059818 TaxID=3346962 RepID=UPI00364CA007